MLTLLKSRTFMLLAAAVITECLLLLIGWRPGSQNPGGMSYATQHQSRGWTTSPGEYLLQHRFTKAKHRVRIASPGRRKVPLAQKPAEEIYMMGGSFVFGLGLPDEQTLPAKLQQRFPEFQFQNLAVPAYGTLQTLITAEEELAQSARPPALVLLCPVAISTAVASDISPSPMLMSIAIGASIAFLTPFSHKANLIVMGAGGYRVKDYFIVGAGLTVLCLVSLTLAIPEFF